MSKLVVDGLTVRLAASELVRGDVVLLAEGDRVPADVELVWAVGFAVDESPLTGESAPVLKHAAAAFVGALGDGLADADAMVLFEGVKRSLGRRADRPAPTVGLHAG